MPVRGFAFHRLDLLGYGLTVDDNRLGSKDLNTLVALNSTRDDLKVKLTHTGDQVLTSLLVDGDTEGGVFLRYLPEHFNELGKVLHVLRLDCDGHDRFTIVFE